MAVAAERISIMSRCRSWRPTADTEHEPGHRPGRCRHCWRPCFRPTVNGQIRCPECEDALANHPDAQVRYDLASEPEIGVDILGLLVSDMDPRVAQAAAWQMSHHLPRPPELAELDGPATHGPTGPAETFTPDWGQL